MTTTKRRRSQRLFLSVSIIVSGQSATGQFSEETHTLVVNAHGALITLAAAVSPEQHVLLKHRATGEEQLCRVVYVESLPKDKAKLGVEFVKPSPHFWHISFPPDDWSPESVASEPDKSVKEPNLPPKAGGTYDMQADRRRTTRYNFGAIAEVIDLGARADLVGVTRDLSLSGCFVNTKMPFAKGTEVIVRIRHSGEDFTATGNVTGNITSEGMGVEFVQIAPKDQAIIEEWLGITSAKTISSNKPSELSRHEHSLRDIPITVSGQSSAGEFTENTELRMTTPNGALVSLIAAVSPGQVIRLRNRLTQVEQNCRVVFVDPRIEQGKPKLLAVEFLEPVQNFGGIKPQS